MQIMVIHTDRETNNQEAVAAVTFNGTDVDAGLDYAYRWTNNLDGSWSQGEEVVFDGCLYDNTDFNPNVKVLAPLRKHLGRTYGHRSSSVGDIMIVDGEAYKVASFGFEKMENA
jgi:hypothetical protein